MQSSVDRGPRLAAIVGPERARRRDCDEHPLRLTRVQDDGVQAQAARSRLPAWTRGVLPHTAHLIPGVSSVTGTEERPVLDAGIHRIRIVE